VLRELHCEPPLTLRRIYGEAGECALCQVGTAAGPLPGDDLLLRLDIGPDAVASLTSAGASIALGPLDSSADADGRGSILRTEVIVGAGAQLLAAPAPIVVTAGARVEASVSIQLAPGATIRWRELIVLGRSRERGGSLRLRWDATCDGFPLLRQEIDLSDSVLASWPVMLHRMKVLASALVVGPRVRARTIVASPTAVVQRLADDAALITVLAMDAGLAQQQVSDLAASIGG
jgi:urease accessory protein